MTLTDFLNADHVPSSLIQALPTIFIILLILAVMVIATGFIIRVLFLRQLIAKGAVILELTPSARGDKTLQATTQLFSVLHGLEETRSMLHKLLHLPAVFSFEIVSTREAGIRFIVRTQIEQRYVIERTLAAYAPDIHIAAIDDYLPTGLAIENSQILSFRQIGYFAYPLQIDEMLYLHDPVAYLAGAMASLKPGELVALQLTLTPTVIPNAKHIADRLLHNQERLRDLGRSEHSVSYTAAKLINTGLFGLLDVVGAATHGPSKSGQRAGDVTHQRQAASGVKPARTLSALEQQLAETVSDKLSQPLFTVSIRSLVVANDRRIRYERSNELRRALGSFGTSRQALRSAAGLFVPLVKKYRLLAFKRRLPTFLQRHSSVLSSDELASIYHFPHSRNANVENVVRSLSKTLPTPVALKQHADNRAFDVVLGRNYHHGSETDLGLTDAERERHVYIIGGTGSGKTTMLQYAIVQDMEHGKGLAVIDPHGDMAETLLRHVPVHRIKDVIYFNPDDLEYPIGLNLLELRPGLTGIDLMREKDLITESVVSIFRKIFSDEDTGGHRIEYVLRNTVQTALTVEDPTLFTIFSLLNDPKYRKKVVASLKDEDLKNFWKHELGKAGEFQRVKMAACITAKIGRFLFSASAKQILEQPRSTIDFDDIINSGKILICNFSKGLLGEDTSELFGITVLAKLQLAALRRARLQQVDRRAFYLYVDEFQNFATPSFVQMLSEARKYKLFMTMAEQSTSQQDDQKMVSIILANVGTVICFRTGNPQDERLLLPLFSPYIEQGEISNLSAFNFYAKLSAIQAQEPVSGRTLLLQTAGSDEVRDSAINHSRSTFAKRKQIDEPAAPVASVKLQAKLGLQVGQAGTSPMLDVD